MLRHSSNRELVQPSEEFRKAYVLCFFTQWRRGNIILYFRIDRIRESNFVEVDYSNITRVSSLLRVAVGRMKSPTAREVRSSNASPTNFPHQVAQLRERVIELLDELNALQADYKKLRKEHAELQVDYGLIREERNELREEIRDLKADKARLEAHNAELLAGSTTRPATPSRESSSANFHTAPSSPQLSQQHPAGGNLSHVPTSVTLPPPLYS